MILFPTRYNTTIKTILITIIFPFKCSLNRLFPNVHDPLLVALFTRVLTSRQNKCRIPTNVLTFSGISRPIALNHARKGVNDSVNCEEIAAPAAANLHPWKPPVPAPVGPGLQQGWIGVYLFVLVAIVIGQLTVV